MNVCEAATIVNRANCRATGTARRGGAEKAHDADEARRWPESVQGQSDRSAHLPRRRSPAANRSQLTAGWNSPRPRLRRQLGSNHASSGRPQRQRQHQLNRAVSSSTCAAHESRGFLHDRIRDGQQAEILERL